ncbi:U-Kazal-Dg21.2-like [Cochliomyia hominivorax]
MNYLSVIIFALLYLCSVQVQAEDCPAICPAVYRPTCGFNGRCYRQFDNDCQMCYISCSQKENFSAVEPGKCEDKSTTKC